MAANREELDMRGCEHHPDLALRNCGRFTQWTAANPMMKQFITSRKKLALLFLLLAVFPLSAQIEHPDADKRRILSLENAWNQAQWQKDAAALNMLLAPDLIYVDYDGTLMGRSEYIADLLSPSVHPLKIFSESMSVHVYAGVAVVNGVYNESGVKNGKPYTERTRFTDTWVRRGETWVCVAGQETSIH
jgi:ketosteroid isomerase-like protein